MYVRCHATGGMLPLKSSAIVRHETTYLALVAFATPWEGSIGSLEANKYYINVLNQANLQKSSTSISCSFTHLPFIQTVFFFCPATMHFLSVCSTPIYIITRPWRTNPLLSFYRSLLSSSALPQLSPQANPPADPPQAPSPFTLDHTPALTPTP